MPKYRLTYGTSDEFYAQTAGEVVPILQDRHMLAVVMVSGHFVVDWR